MTAIPSIDRNTVFVEGGTVALRDEETGGFRDPVPIFFAVPASEIRSNGLSKSESKACEDIAVVFSRMFAQYVNGIKNLPVSAR